MLNNIISKVSALNIFTDLWNTIANNVMKGVYGLYFGLIKAIAWILDMLTQLFFIFSGMTPVSSTSPNVSDGEYEQIDIVNFFLTQKSFQKAYLYLCLIALGLIVVFAIGKIIKQDYFDRTGPRSKGPIFRNIALSFIAFICIIPVFYFLIDAAAALALLVMQAMGYKGGGIGTLIFNISWDDGGKSVRAVAMGLGSRTNIEVKLPEFFSELGTDTLHFLDPGTVKESKVYDPDNFGWYSKDTFFVYYWDSNNAQPRSNVITFHWYIFIFTGLILIVSLGQMMLAMVSRMYKLIALFIIAPSPISQIVLDDGRRFKDWKDRVLQEALKVVGCVMSFMLFIMIVSVVNNLDLMRFAYTSEAASSLSLIEDNNLTTELSDNISAMYYYGDQISWVDRAINAVGRCMIIIAGVGAIKDIDSVITPLLAGGTSSMDMGKAGESISKAGSAVANGALAIGRTAIGAATSGASALVSGAAGAGLSALKGIDAGAKAGKGIAEAGGKAGSLADAAGGKGKDAAEALKNKSDEDKPKTNTPETVEPESGKKGPDGGSGEETDDSATGMGSGAPSAGDGGPGEGTDAESEDKEGADASVTSAGDGGPGGGPGEDIDVESEDKEEADASVTSAGDGGPGGGPGEDIDVESEDKEEADASITSAGDGSPGEGSGAESKDEGLEGKDKKASAETSSSSGSDDSSGKQRFATMHSQGELTKGFRRGKKALGVIGGITVGARRAALGITGHALKTGAKLTGTAVKAGGKIAGILAKTVLSMSGMSGVANAMSGFAAGVAEDTRKTVGKLKGNLKDQGRRYMGSLSKDSTVAKGMGAAKNLGQKFADGGLTGLAFKGASAGLDKLSRSRHRMDPGDKQALDYAVSNGNDSVNSSMNDIRDGGDLSEGAAGVVSGATQQLSDAEGLNNMSETYYGKRNDAVVVNEDQVTQINDAYAQREAMAQNVDSTGVSQLDRIEAMAADFDGEMDAQERSARVKEHKRIVESGDVDHAGMARRAGVKNKKDRSKYLHAIVKESENLDNSYRDVINRVEEAKKTGEALDADTVESYAEYMDKSKELDNAYLYVHSGYGGAGGEGQASFEEMEGRLKSSKEYRADSIDESGHLAAIEKRAENSEGVRVLADESLPDINGIEANASAATKLKAATIRTAAATDNYNAMMAKDSTATAEEKAAAEQKVRESIMDTSRYSDELRTHMDTTRGMVESGSKQNSRANVANAKYEKTRGKVEANIQKMKARNASESSIAKAEARLEALDEIGTGSGAKAGYGDSKRSKVGLTATSRAGVSGQRRMKVKAVTTGVHAAASKVKPTQWFKEDKISDAEARTRFGDMSSSRPVDTIVDVELVEGYDISRGVGGEGLEKMVSYMNNYNGSEQGVADRNEFASSVGEIRVDKIEIDSSKPDDVMKAISQIKKKDVPKAHKGMTAGEYRRIAAARYENAVHTYNTSMEQAASLAREYTTTQNTQTLEAVREAIAKAVSSSEDIRILKTELGIDKNKE